MEAINVCPACSTALVPGVIRCRTCSLPFAGPEAVEPLVVRLTAQEPQAGVGLKMLVEIDSESAAE